MKRKISCDMFVETKLLDTKVAINTAPVDTETKLHDIVTVSSLYCLLVPIPKYLAPNPPDLRLAS